MKLLAVTFAYHPDISEFKVNILKYLNYVEHLIIWDNTPDPDLKSRLAFDSEYDNKIDYMGVECNSGIAYAANRAIEYGLENGYTHILTMDQDSTWEEDGFMAYRSAIERDDEPGIAIYSPRLVISGKIRPDNSAFCYTSGAITSMTIFEKLGLFREDYLIDCVDIEFCLRCRKAGYIIKYLPFFLHHTLGNSLHYNFLGREYVSSDYSPFRLYHIARNNIYLLKDYHNTDVEPNFAQFLRTHFYYLKHIILGEEHKLSKILALINGYMDGIRYKPSKK